MTLPIRPSESPFIRLLAETGTPLEDGPHWVDDEVVPTDDTLTPLENGCTLFESRAKASGELLQGALFGPDGRLVDVWPHSRPPPPYRVASEEFFKSCLRRSAAGASEAEVEPQ